MSSSMLRRILRRGVGAKYEPVQKSKTSVPNLKYLLGRPLGRVQQRGRRLFSGWRIGVTFWAGAATTVLILNIILVIWATYSSYSSRDGVGTLFEGSCSRIARWDLWAHMGINALSTVLLSASNYTMQCSSAPTRKEIDHAHAKGKYVDIGVPSIRNLRRICWSRITLWWLIGLSSIPLHLLYNSAVFQAIGANNYNVVVITEDFLTGAKPNISLSDMDSPGISSSYNPGLVLSDIQNLQANISHLQRLDPPDCISQYSKTMMTGRGSLLAVTNNNSASNGGYIDYVHVSASANMYINQDRTDPRGWLCSFPKNSYSYGQHCDPKIAKNNAKSQEWIVLGHSIQYCLSQQIEEHCKFQFSRTIMMVVIICNLIKAGCMAFMVLKQREENLCTLGDAVESFLKEPDATTVGRCLMDKSDITKFKWNPQLQSVKPTEPKLYRSKRRRWAAAPSPQRWVWCLLLCTGTLVIVAFLLTIGINNLADRTIPTGISWLWSMGFGSVNAYSLLTITSNPSNTAQTLMGYVLLANIPQGILSFLYLMYNGIYTCMLMEDEWNRFAVERKPLRVTSPTTNQRSAYYLSLPYVYALPLAVCSGLMHWLVSQSLFLARITIYDSNGTQDMRAPDFSTCGYSAIAIIFALIVGSLMVLALIATGFRRFRSGMPLGANCSAAISAACHRPPEDWNAAQKPVMWGMVDGKNAPVGHCALSAMEVNPPVEGKPMA